ncbi:MAG: AMP nucleosidase [Granulosicoccaceae bacterium]
MSEQSYISPPPQAPMVFEHASDAVACLEALYERNTAFLREAFEQIAKGAQLPKHRVRAFYPQVSIENRSHAPADTHLSYGYTSGPGIFSTTITRPQLYHSYLVEQLSQLVKNHRMPITVSESQTPIPLHFAFGDKMHVEANLEELDRPLRDIFDTPDLATTDDHIANGTHEPTPGQPLPLSVFTAQRVDYSLARLAHYTATRAEHFQNYVIFTNYQFYVDGFCQYAREALQRGEYTELVEPGNVVLRAGEEPANKTAEVRQPQMPAYHLKRGDKSGITLVNIGVGPSNAKTITDHVAVLRPHAWLMLGHCAGLRQSQRLGDYVLAHAYVREDHVLDADLPVWVPIPALAEVQVALQESVGEITGRSDNELKQVMRTGTVATIDDRNWELRDQREPVRRLSQSRAIALDMESATIAANGFRFRVPYGTLLCVSDKPLHGELKLPGMATAFYHQQVEQHLRIGILAMQKLAQMPPERLHSRKLRSFTETAFQ